MEQYTPFLKWIEHQRDAMTLLLKKWANTNSHSYNLEGLETQLQLVKESFAPLGGDIQELTLPPFEYITDNGEKIEQKLGKALFITKRPDAKIRIFLCGHMDTVYSKNSPFQTVTEVTTNTLLGPGVADMKGGLVILRTALEAFEKSAYCQEIGWELLITPDEEIGSPGSKSILEQCAMRCHLGLIFEPAFSDGAIVSERSGSTNYTIVVHGKAAHAGRDFRKGHSAIFALAPIISQFERLNSREVIVNVGAIHSGHSANVVADRAIAKINARAETTVSMEEVEKKIIAITKDHQREGIEIEVHPGTNRPPKTIDTSTQKMLIALQEYAQLLGEELTFRPSGGVSDGNITAHYGLPTIDTLGAIGGELHSPREYVLLDSLVARAKLAALFLMKVGNGEFVPDKKINTKTIL